MVAPLKYASISTDLLEEGGLRSRSATSCLVVDEAFDDVGRDAGLQPISRTRAMVKRRHLRIRIASQIFIYKKILLLSGMMSHPDVSQYTSVRQTLLVGIWLIG